MSTLQDITWGTGDEDMLELKSVFTALEERGDSRMSEFLGYVRHKVLAGLPEQNEFAQIIGFFMTPHEKMHDEIERGYIAVPYIWDYDRRDAVIAARQQ